MDGVIMEDFYVECDVCKTKLLNYIGSTPCCGSIAYLVDEEGQVTNAFMMYSKED